MCFVSTGFGAITVFDLLMEQLRISRVIWFLRFSLGSNLAALFISVQVLVPAQMIAMLAVYTTGLVVVAWRVFQLRGGWRKAFAVALTMIFYLSILALSVQLPGSIRNAWCYLPLALLGAVAGVGIIAARKGFKGTARANYEPTPFGSKTTCL
jgi:hypothetical protein